ncbi:MAG: hypothetical protein ACRDD7_16385 [Peptostreptococcaceae bacterium]
MDLQELKQKYNYWILKNKDGEKYFKEKYILEQDKQKQFKALVYFNEIAKNLSSLRKPLEEKLGRALTKDEIFNGF